MASLHIIDPGGLSLIEDLGRSGYAAQGVSRSGAADMASHTLAQRLCGNHPSAASIEVLLGGLSMRAEGSCTVAVTGADVDVAIDGVAQGRNHAFDIADGATLTLSRPRVGMRVYVAVRGGFAVDSVLGSRSRDTLGGIGPAPLQRDDRLRIGDLIEAPAWHGVAAVRGPVEDLVLTITLGPHDDALDQAGWKALLRAAWVVDSRSDRIGTRLSGPALPAPTSDLASFPIVPGCVQLPGDGQPVILGPDSGVTGGYPVLGIIKQSGLDALAQARPGARVRLRTTG
jgi:biotin-dependent carboxylase-like uncharacterized protein